MPIGLETWSRPLPVTSRPERLDDLLRHESGHLHGVPERGQDAQPAPLEAEAQGDSGRRRAAARPVRARVALRCADRERELLALRSGDGVSDLARRDGYAVDRDDPVARLQPDDLCAARQRRPGVSGATFSTTRVAWPATVMKRIVKRTIVERDVRRRPGTDGNEPLPGRRLPVRVRADSVAELRNTLLGGGTRGGREPVRAERVVELVDGDLGRGEVVVLERPLHAVDGPTECRRLLDRAREASLGVVRDRPVHPRNRDEAAQRDRPDPVLDPLARRRDDRRWEPDVEAPRAQPDRERRKEVATLVDEDQECESENRNDETHGRILMLPPPFVPRGAGPPRRPGRAPRDRVQARRRQCRAHPRRARRSR